MKTIYPLLLLALMGCSVPMSSLDYDWYYSSEVKQVFDKFEDASAISITPVYIGENTGFLGQIQNETTISFFYVYSGKRAPSFAYFRVVKDSAAPQLESSEFKFENNGQFHKGSLIKYKKHPRQVGSMSLGSYRGSYSESTMLTETADYKFEVAELYPFNRLSSFEFKAGQIYKLSQGYSVSLEKWCTNVQAVIGRSAEGSQEGLLAPTTSPRP
jgi:hypothetical protein